MLGLCCSVLVLLLSGCNAFGIYANIAVSEKIQAGFLPKGLTPLGVFHVRATGAVGGAGYDYFSSGTRLWSRDVTRRDVVTEETQWVDHDLPAGWDAIQSIAVSSSGILAALSRVEVRKENVVRLFYVVLNEDGSFREFRELAGVGDDAPVWGTKGDVHHEVRVMAPDPGGPFFVNVLNYQGGFNDIQKDLTGSVLYSLSAPAGGGDVSDMDWKDRVDVNGGAWTVLEGTAGDSGQFVVSAASNGSVTLFVTADKSVTKGQVIRFAGPVGGTKVNYSADDDAVQGLSWLPVAGGGTFIMSASQIKDNFFSLYVSQDGLSWAKLEKGSSYPINNFADVTGTSSGSSPPRVLGGIRTSDGNSSGGYIELDVSDSDPRNWTVASKREFALENNFLVSDLSDVSVGFSMPEDVAFPDKRYLYAMSEGKGLWRIDADDYTPGDVRPRWFRE